MRRSFPVLVLVLLLIAACGGPATEEPPMPTLMGFPTETPTETPTHTPEATATDTNTPTATNTPTETFTPTVTFTPSDVPTRTPTPNETRSIAGTATAAIEEAPTLATLTPAPAGSGGRPTSTGTPLVIADIVINERQFQEEINLKISTMPDIDSAIVDITPDGIIITVNALGDDGAFTTVDVAIYISVQNGFITMQGALLLDEDAPEPSERFITLLTSDFFLEAVNSLDTMIKQRLGEQNDLETVRLTDNEMLVTLYVPEGASP